MAKDDAVKTIQECADRFHTILSALTARRKLTNERQTMPTPIYEMMVSKALDNAEIEKLAADGFEALVRLLADAGVPGVTIFECNPTEEP